MPHLVTDLTTLMPGNLVCLMAFDHHNHQPLDALGWHSNVYYVDSINRDNNTIGAYGVGLRPVVPTSKYDRAPINPTEIWVEDNHQVDGYTEVFLFFLATAGIIPDLPVEEF